MAECGGADFIHLDIEDGVFIPNLTFGPKTIRDLRPLTHVPFDVHLQVTDPRAFLMDVVKAGANRICFQLEATEVPEPLLEKLKVHRVQVGLALLATTPLETLAAELDRIDFIHLMTNDPENGSDDFMPEMLSKIRRSRTLIGVRSIEIEVDGGINSDNAAMAVQAGAAVLVAGRAIWESNNPINAISRLQRAASMG
jgi:ribulose-phosphate 3-epimerase